MSAEFHRVLNSRLLGGVDPTLLTPVLGTCPVRQVAAGEALLTPGQANRAVYIVLEGALRVHLDRRDEPPFVTLEPGDCAGEMSIIDGKHVSAWVVAVEPARVLVVGDDVLWAMVDRFHEVARNLLHVLCGRMRDDQATLVGSLRQSRALERAALVDALTGLHNRRWLDEGFPRQLAACVDLGQPVTLAMLDIDRFKTYNDQQGHPAGDCALRAVAHALHSGLRGGDLLARYGGEEFCLLLPNANLDAATAIAERLRGRVSSAFIEDDEEELLPGVTISIGLAEARPGESLGELMGRADRALYQAKAGGRNRVCA